MQDLRQLTPRSHSQFQTEKIAPDAPFWAIGDVHGCYDILAPLLDDLLQTGEHIVLLGDMINKGPQSAAVLRLVKDAYATGQVTALRGNHEELLLRFLDKPRLEAKHLLLYGGDATLNSFGVTGFYHDMALWELSKIRNKLREQMGDIEDWLAACPRVWRSGNVAALHAGADPQQGLDAQPDIVFPWGHPLFHKKNRIDGVWIVHGHQPVPEVTVKSGRIAVETQGYLTGKLSAVRIAKGKIEAR